MPLELKQKIIPHMKRVTIKDVTYDSIAKAAKCIGVCSATITNRIKSPKFPNYKYS